MIFFRILVLCLVCSMSDLNAFRITEFNHPTWFNVKYKSYCFSEGESKQIREAIEKGATLFTAIAQIPGAKAVAGTISAALGVAAFTVWWASARGKKGFSVNIAPGGEGAPYLWESD